MPQNLYVHKVSFEGVRKLIKSKFGYEPDLDVPWDFCKFKCVYGKIFEGDLVDADYWGWTDFDVIYGDLSPIYDICEKGYDKVMPLGHLSVVKNDARLMAGILANPLVDSVLDKNSPEMGMQNFDEVEFPLEILPKLNAKQYNDIPFAQFYARYGCFRISDTKALCDRLGLVEGRHPSTVPNVFTWQNGHLVGWFAMSDRTVIKVECVYIHFFKRDMKALAKSFEQGKSYLIVPNQIHEYDGHDLTWSEIARLDYPRIHWSYFAKRLTPKRIIKKLKEIFGKKWQRKQA